VSAANAQEEGAKQVLMVPAETIGASTKDIRIGKGEEVIKGETAQEKRGMTPEVAFHAAKVAKADIKEPRLKDDAIAVVVKEPRRERTTL
jgi:hypothetical protein